MSGIERSALFTQMFRHYKREPTKSMLDDYTSITAEIPIESLQAAIRDAQRVSGHYMPAPGDVWAAWHELEKEARRREANRQLDSGVKALPAGEIQRTLERTAPRELLPVLQRARELRKEHPNLRGVMGYVASYVISMCECGFADRVQQSKADAGRIEAFLDKADLLHLLEPYAAVSGVWDQTISKPAAGLPKNAFQQARSEATPDHDLGRGYEAPPGIPQRFRKLFADRQDIWIERGLVAVDASWAALNDLSRDASELGIFARAVRLSHVRAAARNANLMA